MNCCCSIRPHAATPVWRDQLDAQGCQRRIQRVRIVGAVANQALGELVEEAGVEGGATSCVS
jgi:hypothetical protein